MSVLITLTNLGFTQPGQTELLDIPSFHLEHGESLFLKGPSGGGKTTLLGLLDGVQRPGRSSIHLLGKGLEKLSAARRDHFHVDHTGYIFQQFNLLPFLPVRENVELPCHFSVLHRQCARERHDNPAQVVSRLLDQLGLDDGLHARHADSLSIDQQRRAAATRVLTGQPELVIADEPTPALDVDSHEAFFQLLFAECREAGASPLLVSRDQSLAGLSDRNPSLFNLNRAARPAGLWACISSDWR